MVPLNPPNTIYLGGAEGAGGEGGIAYVNDIKAGSAVTPGDLIELYNNANILNWRRHSTASGTFAAAAFALDQPFLNQGINNDYAANDLVLAGIMQKGSTVYAWVASGQTLVPGDKMESAGTGGLKKGTTAPIATSLEAITATAAKTRVRVEVI